MCIRDSTYISIFQALAPNVSRSTRSKYNEREKSQETRSQFEERMKKELQDLFNSRMAELLKGQMAATRMTVEAAERLANLNKDHRESSSHNRSSSKREYYNRCVVWKYLSARGRLWNTSPKVKWSRWCSSWKKTRYILINLTSKPVKFWKFKYLNRQILKNLFCWTVILLWNIWKIR